MQKYRHLLLMVAQLMDNHVIQHFRRCFHQQAVKVKIALCTAASPACTLVSYGDPAIGHADNRGIKPYPFRNYAQCFICKHLQFPGI